MASKHMFILTNMKSCSHKLNHHQNWQRFPNTVQYCSPTFYIKWLVCTAALFFAEVCKPELIPCFCTAPIHAKEHSGKTTPDVATSGCNMMQSKPQWHSPLSRHAQHRTVSQKARVLVLSEHHPTTCKQETCLSLHFALFAGFQF